MFRNSFAVSCAAALTAVVLSVGIQPAKAAVITWGSPQNIAGASDVVTTGTLFASANFFQTGTAAGSGTIVVNGVTFSGFGVPSVSGSSGPTTLTVGNITLTGTSNQPSFQNLRAASITDLGPAGYNGMLSQFAFLYNASQAPTMGVTVAGLTTGAEYLIQYWVQDSRTGSGIENRTTVVGGKTLDVNVTNTIGGFGQYVTGTFTADSSTQSFNAVGGVGGVAYANAMQVRMLAVPEPAALAMAGAGVALAGTYGVHRRRRRVSGKNA